jgi:hypothetical protein
MSAAQRRRTCSPGLIHSPAQIRELSFDFAAHPFHRDDHELRGFHLERLGKSQQPGNRGGSQSARVSWGGASVGSQARERRRLTPDDGCAMQRSRPSMRVEKSGPRNRSDSVSIPTDAIRYWELRR